MPTRIGIGKGNCPHCRGTGNMRKFSSIHLMDEIKLAQEIHRIAMERWGEDNPKDSIICLAFELKTNLKKRLEPEKDRGE